MKKSTKPGKKISSFYQRLRAKGEKAFRESTGKNELEAAYKKELAKLIDQKSELIANQYIERINCPVCHASEQKLLFIKQGLNFVQCPDCKLIFTNPHLNKETLARIYSNEKIANIFIKKVLESKAQQEFDRVKYLKAIVELQPFLPQHPYVIDVGCANGLFLHLCQEQGFKCSGVEISPIATDYSRNKYNLDIYCRAWEDFEIRPSSVDLVTFWASHSYLREPILGLRKAFKILKHNGILMMLVDGNPNSITMRVLHEHCVGFEFTRLWYFAPSVLDKVLTNIGFKILKMESIIHNLDAIFNYLEYRHPYQANHINSFVTQNEKKYLENYFYRHCMGYKYFVFAKK